MAITLTTDPIITSEDAQALFDLTDEMLAALLVNALTEKFKRFTNRVQLQKDLSTQVVEWLRAFGTDKLYLHASPVRLVDDSQQAIECKAEIYNDTDLLDTYTYADSEFRVETDDRHSLLELYSGSWPSWSESQIVKVSYYAGWSETPGDVLEGAVLQGKIDLLRLKGEVGVESRGAQGESTRYDTSGLIKAVRDLWRPYVVLP